MLKEDLDNAELTSFRRICMPLVAHNHWELVVAFVSQGELLYLDPLGERKEKTEAVLKKWRLVKFTVSWIFTTIVHIFQ
jgi:hypothetical protein